MRTCRASPLAAAADAFARGMAAPFRRPQPDTLRRGQRPGWMDSVRAQAEAVRAVLARARATDTLLAAKIDSSIMR